MTNGLSIGDYRYASLWDGCIGAWCPSATGPGGDILADRSPTQRHGILTSMDPETDWSVQEDGVALDFDGSNDRVLINGYADYADMTETTVAAWVYTRSSASQTFFCCSSSSVAAPILWMLDCSSTTLRFLVRNDGGSTAVAQLAASILTDQWMHLVGVRSSSGIELFRNGVSINSASTVITGAITPTDTLIGARNLGSATPTVFTNGLIDDVRAYSRALSPSDIQLLASRRGIAYERRIRRSYKAAAGGGSVLIGGKLTMQSMLTSGRLAQ